MSNLAEDDDYDYFEDGFGPNGECWHQDECECDLSIVTPPEGIRVVRKKVKGTFQGSCNFCSNQQNAAYELTGLNTSVRLCTSCAESLKKQLRGLK